MVKKAIGVMGVALLCSCQGAEDDVDKDEPVVDSPLSAQVMSHLSAERIREHVEVLADDSRGGRIPGSFGHAEARDYIHGQMMEIGLQPWGWDDEYEYDYANDPVDGRYQMEPDGSIIEHEVSIGTNLIGLIPGTDPARSDETMVVMAHYDHLGVTLDGKIFNGAYDNATAVGMCLELARVIIEQDAAPARSILFIFTDDEESGLEGAEAWLADSTVPLDKVVMGVSVDPIGRPMLPDYAPMVMMGLERSPSLMQKFREAAEYSVAPVTFVHRDVIPVFSSDQDEFFKIEDPIPAVWFTNPGMSFYHTVDDTPDTIDYRTVKDNANYLGQVLTVVGNDDQFYAYSGPPPVDGAAAVDVKVLFDGVLNSEWISSSERDVAEGFRDDLELVIAADDVNAVDNPDVLFFAGAYFLLFQLSQAHPGPIPPPFPED